MRGRSSFEAWNFTTQNSLRALAEQTGGRAIVNRNDFDDVFREIDAETSDYYILGFALTTPARRSRPAGCWCGCGGGAPWTCSTARTTPTSGPARRGRA